MEEARHFKNAYVIPEGESLKEKGRECLKKMALLWLISSR
jgi:hypothetical protein